MYLKSNYRKKVRKHFIDKGNIKGNVERGIIFLYEEPLPLPEWVNYLYTISSKKDIDISPSKISKAVVFITLKGETKTTFALTFGNGSTLLDTEHIVSDFGLKISKSLLTVGDLIEVNSTSIDRKFFNTKKQSIEFLMPEKILEYGTQNILRNIHGVHKQDDNKFSLGGKDSLSFGGDIDLLNDLERWLSEFASLYAQGDNNLGVSDDLISVNKQTQEILDNKLAKKILDIINTSPLTRRQTSSIRVLPNEIFDLTDFNGFFISGLGYKKSKVSSDFFIDELNFFERFQRQVKSDKKSIDGILKKIKTDKIYRKILNSAELEPVCTVYKAINYEIQFQDKKYILISGKWYEIDKEFYSNLKKEIDAIKSPDESSGTRFIKFDPSIHIKYSKGKKHLSEGKYNEDLAEKSKVLMLDRQDYKIDRKTLKKYGFKEKSSIELCDVIYFDIHKIQFVHVKRHAGGASGTSHLLTQALVSSHAFLNDNTAVINHINEKVDQFNAQTSSYNFMKLNYSGQTREVVLAIIDKDNSIGKANSALLSVLEMVSMRENIRNLEHLGFQCYLKFIPGHP